jgi:hypothetical protein
VQEVLDLPAVPDPLYDSIETDGDWGWGRKSDGCCSRSAYRGKARHPERRDGGSARASTTYLAARVVSERLTVERMLGKTAGVYRCLLLGHSPC